MTWPCHSTKTTSQPEVSPGPAVLVLVPHKEMSEGGERAGKGAVAMLMMALLWVIALVRLGRDYHLCAKHLTNETSLVWIGLSWLSCGSNVTVLVDRLTRTKVVVVLIVNCLSDSRSNKAVFAPMSRCYCLDGKVCLGQLEVCRLPRRPPVQQQHRPGHGEGNLQPWQRVQGALLLQYGAQWSGHGGKVVDNVGATATTSARASSDLPSHNGSLGEHFTYLWTTLQLTNGIPVACHNCCSAIILPPSISWLNIVNIFCQWPSIIIRRANEILRGSVWCPDL